MPHAERNIQTRIFVSYNPGIEIEQPTALRLPTLSSLYGAVVHLPDRIGLFLLWALSENNGRMELSDEN